MSALLHPSVPLWAVIDALAVYRLTMLVTRDLITDRPREWVKRRGAGWADFITCPWCTSVWLAAGVVALTLGVPLVWAFVALVLAFSAVAGFLAEHG